MLSEDFNRIFEYQFQTCQNILADRAKQYATEDRLHNFKVAAKLQGCSIQQAIAGMMVKHTVSVYDMAASDKAFELDLWDEKITDNINYLILLKAAIQEKLPNDIAIENLKGTS